METNILSLYRQNNPAGQYAPNSAFSKRHPENVKTMAGISKSQRLLITASPATVLVINAIGMWHDFLFYELRRTQLPEIYELHACGNPWPKIIPETFGVALFLFALGWLTVYISRRPSLQELPLAMKYVSELLIAISIGSIFMGISVWFSSIWVYDFWCGPVFGLLKSSLVVWSSTSLVWPATSKLMFWAVYLSNPLVPYNHYLH